MMSKVWEARMRKLIAVAISEYRQVVLTKSFLFSLLLPLIIYGAMFFFGYFFGDKMDLKDRRVGVVDNSGILYEHLEASARERNRGDSVYEKGKQVKPRFLVEQIDGSGKSRRELLIELSDRVRKGSLFAFAFIGEDYADIEGGDADYVEYFSNSPTFNQLPDWLYSTLTEEVERLRFGEAGMDFRRVQQMTSHNSLDRYKLANLDEEGNLIDPEEENRIAAVLIPIGIMMIIFFAIQMTTPILLNSVIEEKMQRIAEVLLSSVSPFQLMSGKLIGGVAVGLTFSAVYMGTLALSLSYFESAGWVAPGTYFWFFIFLILGMLAFGSLFAGLSSACQDLKDSQNFAGSVVILLVIPLVLSMVVIESPDGPFAQVLSMIPPFSIFIMMLRVSIPPGPETWEVVLSAGLTLLFAIATIWLASRIFRIGILSQGKTPTLRELFRWILSRG